VRGAGGWGGDRGPSADINVAPDRAPDKTVEQKIDDNQALLYRLSGDWNPLHADPGFAQAFGFDRPILHGLCTYGYATRHILRAFAKDSDPGYFKSIKVRFKKPVFPGETLVTEMWKESDTRIVFRCKVKERDEVVLTNAAVNLYTEIPKKKEKLAAMEGDLADAGPAELIPADVFSAVGDHITAHPELTEKVQKVFLWKVEGGGSWTMNLKDAGGGVTPGASGTPDCTLEITASDFIDMCTGKADAQKLYFGGKLKISGDVMASQKLTFLKDIDAAAVRAEVQKRMSGGAGAGSDAAPVASRSAAGPALFEKLGARIAGDAGIAAEVRAVLQFRLTDPDAAWLVDLSEGNGAVKPGTRDGADVVFTLSDEDFEALVRGESNVEDLHQRGALRVDGDIHLAQRLSFLEAL
jgi:3-hydroxyacyl-CoA dehydrogenase/3a,7a,12a-trihydroxy-5b-cholest-24-enoyl-CoA hydratase